MRKIIPKMQNKGPLQTNMPNIAPKMRKKCLYEMRKKMPVRDAKNNNKIR